MRRILIFCGLLAALTVLPLTGRAQDSAAPPAENRSPESTWAEFMKLRPKKSDLFEAAKTRDPYRQWAFAELWKLEKTFTTDERVTFLKAQPPEPMAKKTWEQIALEAAEDQLFEVWSGVAEPYHRLATAELSRRDLSISTLTTILRFTSKYAEESMPDREFAESMWQQFLAKNPSFQNLRMLGCFSTSFCHRMTLEEMLRIYPTLTNKEVFMLLIDLHRYNLGRQPEISLYEGMFFSILGDLVSRDLAEDDMIELSSYLGYSSLPFGYKERLDQIIYAPDAKKKRELINLMQ